MLLQRDNALFFSIAFYKRKKPLKCDVFMNNNIIVFNFLGIIFNNNLTWIDHINNFKLQLAKTVGILRHIFPSDILKNIY